MEFHFDGQQYVSMQELHDAGYSNYKIRQMTKAGNLVSVNKKWFENSNYSGEINDFYAVPVHAEKGIVCLISAAVYYGLLNERPNMIDVAIPRNARIPQSPPYPPMRFYRMVEQRYGMGIVKIHEGRNFFMIYDKEKTVCDIIYHRNKLGFEPAMETLRRYTQQRDRDINKLLNYAKQLQVEETIRRYLEVLL